MQLDCLKLVREILSLRIDQLEAENKVLKSMLLLNKKSLALDTMKVNIELQNPGKVLNEDFELVDKEGKDG